jgi:hypothetical protein
MAQTFNLPQELVQAVVNAEGNILAAVRCSLPSVTTREEALRVLCRSIVHRMTEFIVDGGHAPNFVRYFGSKWAPIGVTNDPTNLNQFWANNVLRIWNV